MSLREDFDKNGWPDNINPEIEQYINSGEPFNFQFTHAVTSMQQGCSYGYKHDWYLDRETGTRIPAIVAYAPPPPMYRSFC